MIQTFFLCNNFLHNNFEYLQAVLGISPKTMSSAVLKNSFHLRWSRDLVPRCDVDIARIDR